MPVNPDPFGPQEGPSFDNFSQFVTALKLQFLKGVPPTPENVNLAQARAEQIAMNPDAGATKPALQDAPGGAGADAVDLPQAASAPHVHPPAPTNAPLPPVSPNTVAAPLDADAENVVPSTPEDSENGFGAVGVGVGISALKILFDKLNADGGGLEARQQAGRKQLIAPERPLGLPAPDVNPRNVITPQNEQSNRGVIRRGGPEQPLALPAPEDAPIAQGASANAADRATSQSAVVTPEEQARVGEAIDKLDPNTRVTFNDFPDKQLLGEVMDGLVADGSIPSKNFNSLTPKLKRVVLNAFIATQVITTIRKSF